MKLIFITLLCIIYSNAYAGDFVRNNHLSIVLDIKTGLIWEDDKQNTNNTFTWSSALSYCNSLSLAGYSDWRLPNINELSSIIDYDKFNPAIPSAFEHVTAKGFYWSSTTWSNENFAIGVGFTSGAEVNAKKIKDNFKVRCVRGGN